MILSNPFYLSLNLSEINSVYFDVESAFHLAKLTAGARTILSTACSDNGAITAYDGATGEPVAALDILWTKIEKQEQNVFCDLGKPDLCDNETGIAWVHWNIAYETDPPGYDASVSVVTSGYIQIPYLWQKRLEF